MKYSKILSSGVVLSTVVFPSFGATTNYAATLNKLMSGVYWGATCQAHTLTDICIGESRDSCSGTFSGELANPDYTSDERVVLLLLAREVNANGAKFCPTQAVARNKNSADTAWTTYTDVSGGGSTCVWLCKKGYTGPECSTPSGSVKTCDTTPFTRDLYKDIKRSAKGAANIEDKIPMWGANVYNNCTDGRHIKSEEHDLPFAIVQWLPSGHGAFAQGIVVLAAGTNESDIKSYIKMWPSAATNNSLNGSKVGSRAKDGKKILLCKDGFQANSSNTDCEPINKEICGILPEWCPGYKESDKTNEHIILQQEVNGTQCRRLACSKSGYAFASTTDKKCVECTGDNIMLVGIDKNSGVCVHCSVGEAFNQKTNRCAPAVTYNKNDLMYGKGKSKESYASINWQDTTKRPCWTDTSTDFYTKCVYADQATSSPSGGSN